MKIEKLSQFLTKVSIFNKLSPVEISKYLLQVDFKIKKYKKDETVFFRGDFLENVIIVIKCSVQGEMQKFNGDSIVINQLESGEVIFVWKKQCFSSKFDSIRRFRKNLIIRYTSVEKI